jgi:hypothetical protein
MPKFKSLKKLLHTLHLLPNSSEDSASSSPPYPQCVSHTTTAPKVDEPEPEPAGQTLSQAPSCIGECDSSDSSDTDDEDEDEEEAHSTTPIPLQFPRVRRCFEVYMSSLRDNAPSLRSALVAHVPSDSYPPSKQARSTEPPVLTQHSSAAATGRLDTNGTRHPWWLAEKIVKSALHDDTLESHTVQVLSLLGDAFHADEPKVHLMAHILELMEHTQDLLSYALQDGVLKNAFDTDTVFVTIYYVVLFLVTCVSFLQETSDTPGDGTECEEVVVALSARCVAVLNELEPVCVHVAALMSKLLLNREVYEFVAECWRNVDDAACWRCLPTSVSPSTATSSAKSHRST